MSLSRRRRRRMLNSKILDEKNRNNEVVKVISEPELVLKNEETPDDHVEIVQVTQEQPIKADVLEAPQVNEPAVHSETLEEKIDDSVLVDNDAVTTKKKGKRFGKD